MSVPESEELFVEGDFNGHVRDMNVGYERVHGGWGFGSWNQEGETLLQAACAFDLKIVNTFYKKETQHESEFKVTGIYPYHDDLFDETEFIWF
jgi:hypothetical protein